MSLPRTQNDARGLPSHSQRGPRSAVQQRADSSIATVGRSAHGSNPVNAYTSH
ncbi:hypothetical protein BDV34DRAFT_60347 [Aspergillus parasiticus]|uniref:Uncharacterized protein n=1 Tax=Aspergillus parasiticus TaxID=5067 RepID=A0A5N6DSD1_ASPPA|nr:hypothetical protein BDV34DRAFT_60347 [Aspergillus parasiticus]